MTMVLFTLLGIALDVLSIEGDVLVATIASHR